MIKHVSLLLVASVVFVAFPAAAAESALTPQGQEDWAPAWSADGRSIACLTARKTGRAICLMAADGSWRRVLRSPRGDLSKVTFSPDGRLMAVEGKREGEPFVWLRTLDGEAYAELPGARTPAFSPDGSRVAYATSEGVVLRSASGERIGKPVRVAATGTSINPGWSPEGKHIFCSREGSIWSARLPGGTNAGAPVATLFVARERYPYRKILFSPDGRRTLIVGDSSVATGEQLGDPLWVADANGKGPHRVPAGYSPSWVPHSGKRIVCARGDTICLLASDGGKAVELTKGRAPAVSPDGRCLAFERKVVTGEDDLFGVVKTAKVIVMDLLGDAKGAYGAPLPSTAPPPEWPVRIPATVDTGLRDRADTVVRATVDLGKAAKQAGVKAYLAPHSLRVFERQGGAWREVPSRATTEKADRNLCHVAWLMPGKREMLTEHQFTLCFRPSGPVSDWKRPPWWRQQIPSLSRTNLVPNPSFEISDRRKPALAKAWTPATRNAQAEVVEENPYHGRRCALLAAADPMTTPAWYSEYFRLDSLKKYAASYAVRSEIEKGIPPVVWLYFYDSKRQPISRDIMVRRVGLRGPPPSARWQTVKRIVTTPKDVAYGRITVSLWRTVGKGWIDDICVEPFVRRDPPTVTLGRAARAAKDD